METELPWSSQRINLSHKEWVLETVKRILDRRTQEKINLLKDLLIDEGMITTPDIIEDVTNLIFEKAVLERDFIPKYAELFSDLYEEIPVLPSEGTDRKVITLKRVLMNSCQEVFEGTDNIMAEIGKMTGPDQELERRNKERMMEARYVGNIYLIGELCKRQMVPLKIVLHVVQQLLGHHDGKTCLEEKNVEAICRLFSSIGKQLDGTPRSDAYFEQLKELTMNPQIAPRWKFVLRNILDLRAENWNPGLKESTSSMQSGRSPNLARSQCERCGVRYAEGRRCNGCTALEDEWPFNFFALWGDKHHTTVQLKYQMLGFQASVERKIRDLEEKTTFYLRLIVGLIVSYIIFNFRLVVGLIGLSASYMILKAFK